jgi:hypothetical protein
LAGALGHELLRIDDGRLSDLHWFRTDWQRGGAATALAHWRDACGTPRDCVVKVPVNQRELRWMRRLGAGDECPVAQLFSSGDEIGPYDFAWIVIERVSHGPLALHWHPTHVQRIAEAAARFHRATCATPVDQAAQDEDWDALLKSAREHARDPSVPERSRWTSALKELTKKIDRIVARWRGPAHRLVGFTATCIQQTR